MMNRQMLVYYLMVYNMYDTIYLNHIPVRTAAFLAQGRTVEEAYLCIFEHAFICVVLEMAWSRMLRAAQIGKLVRPTKDFPEQPDLVLYKQLAPPRTPLLSKNTRLCSVAPPQSPQKSQYLFFSEF